ncbi:MAG: hypothetical protein EZS28_038368 [Streblomastix strix]|uniref:Uncharacterized protein n=1 Tax=Streblomastix strix TaxID=222440 RepID=A0A5J4U5J3_9EUKA|nr:MAG: hypothetical protein EZS28_038368 [Streblomastix strix]
MYKQQLNLQFQVKQESFQSSNPALRSRSKFRSKESKRRTKGAQTFFTKVGGGAKLDLLIAQQEKKETIQRNQPQNSQVEAKSEEIGGILRRFCAAWAAIREEKQVMMGIMPL